MFDTNGQPAGEYDVPVEAQNQLARPIGIATDGSFVLVSDSTGQVMRKIPIAEVVK